MGGLADQAQAGALSEAGLHVQHTHINHALVQTVNARDLHEFLQVGKDFSTWIKDRIVKYGFVLDQDFTLETNDSPVSGNQKGRGGDRRSVQYHLSLDMAKELAMVERNEKGKQARLYFIECERKAKAQTSSKRKQMAHAHTEKRGAGPKPRACPNVLSTTGSYRSRSKTPRRRSCRCYLSYRPSHRRPSRGSG
ncbi:antA/AntB antirepressor family protein [Herbaspirillum rubrisubalbicans]|uniref:antA/AntB antirepressor family protein n=1 Tax=Herbaspirillum rubrisubalbicans TaxID=80842 RepID=UPI000DD310E6